MKSILIGAALLSLAVSAPACEDHHGGQAQMQSKHAKMHKDKGGGHDCKECKLGRGGKGGGGMSPQGMKGRAWGRGGAGGGAMGGHGMRRAMFGPAQQGLQQKVMMKGHMLMMHAAALKLTPAQQDEIKKALHDANKKNNTLTAEIDNLKIDIHAGLAEEKIDAAKLKNLIDKKHAAKAKSAKLWVEAQASMQGVLNKEQLEEIRAFRYGLKEEDESAE